MQKRAHTERCLLISLVDISAFVLSAFWFCTLKFFVASVSSLSIEKMFISNWYICNLSIK